ncbi:MAG: 2-octaprenyl-6-methoxyphenyl hydroxylase [Nitrococcus mobilis]|nr:2-octaprenyl-6-methoxyphenyl hydroxylase [Nitrococcus mobilis]
MSAALDYEVIIVGGGLVGASLACALATAGVRVAVIEPFPPEVDAQPSFDERQIALAPATRRIFEALGLWPAIALEATPIREIHVSEQGGFGITRMSAAEEGLDALGYILPSRRLGAVLFERLRARPEITLYCPAKAQDVAVDATAATVRIESERGMQSLSAPLLAVCDGARSRIRERLGIRLRERSYQQVAVIANVTPERNPEGRAYERFLVGGPLGVLPAAGGGCAVIWSVPVAVAEAVLKLDEPEFLAQLQAVFGYRLGRFLAAGKRSAYPLAVLVAERCAAQRALVIGNAAHTLHPVAGQGFNLALRDVAVVAELVTDTLEAGGDPGEPQLLERYQRLRRIDYQRTLAFTDGIVRLFSNRLPGLTLARNLGLLLLDLFPGSRQILMHQAMGRSGWLPRLARGLPLAHTERRVGG